MQIGCLYGLIMDKKTGPKLLAEWLKDTGRKAKWAALTVPVNRSHFHMWLNGTHTPRAIYRERLAEMTDGAVPVDSWEREG